MKSTIRIGCGAGFSGDRLDPSVVLVDHGNLDYLVLECLAERTIGLAQKRKLQNPNSGFDPLLERRMESLLELLIARKVRLITNMGAANPLAAAAAVVEIARRKNLKVAVAAVTGDDVISLIDTNASAMETGKPLKESGAVISANAYLGVEGILEALATDAQIIITGRVADPSLFLAPMIHEFGWDRDNFDLMGKGTIVGHLMECAGHLTGGYYCDPGRKDVPDMVNLGHPIAEISPDGTAVLSKVAGTGGVINLMTAKEQLLYEVVNPHEYVTPDVVADFTTVSLAQHAPDQVRVTGGTGKQRPENYKVSVGYHAFWLGEGEITYAGSNAVARARLAGETVVARLGDAVRDARVDLVGINSVHGDRIAGNTVPYEVRLRVSARATSAGAAALVGEEVEALYTNGPAGGGGVRKYSNEVIGIVSTLLPRERVSHHLSFFNS